MLVPGQYEQVPVMKCSVRSVDTMVVDVYRNEMSLGDLVLFLLPPCPFKNRQWMCFGVEYPMVERYDFLVFKQKIEVFKSKKKENIRSHFEWCV